MRVDVCPICSAGDCGATPAIRELAARDPETWLPYHDRMNARRLPSVKESLALLAKVKDCPDRDRIDCGCSDAHCGRLGRARVYVPECIECVRGAGPPKSPRPGA